MIVILIWMYVLQYIQLQIVINGNFVEF